VRNFQQSKPLHLQQCSSCLVMVLAGRGAFEWVKILAGLVLAGGRSDNLVCRGIPDPKNRKETCDHGTEDGCWLGGDRGVIEGVIGGSMRG
jgi:hypothetical protein